MRRLLVVAAVLASLAGCATKRPIEYAERKYKLSEVEKADACEFLGTVRGKSDVGGGKHALRGQELATADAIRVAASRGATHYVLGEATSDRRASAAQIKAYRCAK